MFRPTWMEIDLDLLSRNIAEVRKTIGQARRLIAVAKGNAYGLGLLETVPVMFESGADVVAVGSLEDGIALRKAGCAGPLLLFASFLHDDAAEAVLQYDLIPTVWDVESASVYSRLAGAKHVEVYLKVDAGMHRLGVRADEAVEVAKRIEQLGNVRIDCVYTHFSDPLSEEEFTRRQFERFVRAIDGMREVGVSVPYACCASSFVVSMYRDMYLGGVDVGRLIFGFLFLPDPVVKLDVHPVVRAVKSRILQTKWIAEGDTVGYGRAFRADRRTLVGIVPMGWWDGFVRGGHAGANVLVRGKRCPLVGGGISLEYSVIDLTAVKEAVVGDEVLIIGEQRDGVITIGDCAKWAGLSELELLIGMGKTLPKRYLGKSLDSKHRTGQYSARVPR